MVYGIRNGGLDDVLVDVLALSLKLVSGDKEQALLGVIFFI